MEKRWQPTTKTWEDPARFSPLKARIYRKKLKLREPEMLEPTLDDDQRRTFLKRLSRENSGLNPRAR